MTNKEKVNAIFAMKKPFSILNENDIEWLMASANEGDVKAACLIIYGMYFKYQYEVWTYVDDDTNEKQVHERDKLVEGTTFERDSETEKRLRQMVWNHEATLSIEDLYNACYFLVEFLPQSLALDRINRGDELAARSIDDPVILQELCEKGNKTAFREMGDKYTWGDEINGIFIDLEKAKAYYEKAGDDYRYETDIGLSVYKYILRGPAAELEAVKTLVNELTNRHGIPDKKLGMYVPMEILMKTLVGSQYYRGKLLSMDTDDSGCIVLWAEANFLDPVPLFYALRQAFPNLEIEMKQ